MGLFDFFGKGARRDLQDAQNRANAELVRAQRQSIDTRNEFLDRSIAPLQGGLDANELLMQAAGVRGAGPQNQFFANFQNDPGFAAQQQAGIDAIDNSAASRGMMLSGGNLRDLNQFGMRFQRDAFNDRLRQLQALTGNAPAQVAQLTANTGGQIADTQFGGGQLAANNAINFGNAMAANRQVGMQNALGTAEAIGRIASSFAGM